MIRKLALMLGLMAALTIPSALPAQASIWGSPVMTCDLSVNAPTMSGGVLYAKAWITCDGVSVPNGTQQARVFVRIYKYYGSGVWSEVAQDGFNYRYSDGTVSANAAEYCTTSGAQFYASASGSATDINGTYTGLHYVNSSQVTRPC